MFRECEPGFRECQECGQPFEVTEAEIAFQRTQFGGKYRVPTRCKFCRRLRRRSSSVEAKRQPSGQ